MSVIKTKQELDSVISKLRANEVSNKFSELRTNKESNNYDWLRFYTAGEDLIKNAVAKYNLQKYRELSSSGSFEFSELSEQAADATKKEELTKVQRVSDNKYNLINADGKLLSKQWFDWVSDFYGEVAVVVRGNGDHNFINKQGNIISEQWFEFVGDFSDGFARVKRVDRLWNLIGENGKFLSNEWFSYVDYFKDGFARVQRTNGEQCKIDKNGKIS